MQREEYGSITAVIATKPRWTSLTQVSIPSVVKQTRRPDRLLVISDRYALEISELRTLRELADGIPVEVLSNQLAPGAAGTWNTGFSWLTRFVSSGYVALLDDDDEWDSEHLECCEKVTAAAGWVDVVLSGLRVIRSGVELTRQPLTSISRDDFLAGNPGWQGTNTFAKLSVLARVGGFTNGMPSANDRDLAVRLLSLPDLTMSFTNKMTSTWHLDSEPDALSRRGGSEKREGLAWFLRKHGHLMTPDIRARFLTRARDLFDVNLCDVRNQHGK
jgi:hypothetical protein